MEYSIAGILIIPMVLGLVEMAKRLGVQGEWSTVLAVFLGIVFGSLVYGINEALIPEPIIPYIQWGVFSLGFRLSIPGLYKIGKRFSLGDG